MNKRPNILLITSDQHRPDCYGFAGRKVRTPFLDRLAAGGTRFETAITPNVVCQPARASILTGLLPLTHGVSDNQIRLDAAIGEAGWAGTLTRHGYRTHFLGKAHFGEDPACTPFGAPESRPDSANFPPDWRGPYMGFSEAELMILGHWHPLLPCEKPPRGHQFERWFWSHPHAWSLWSQDLGPASGAAQTWHSALPAAWHSTEWVTQRAKSFLERMAGDDDERPFVSWVSYPDPHHPFDCPEPWSRLHHPDDVDISPTHARDLDKRPWWHRAALENEPAAHSEKMRELRKTFSRIEPQTDAQLRAMTANYYGMISFIDDGVGRILDTLAQTGLDKDTIVVFTSDHGELLGDHGLYLKGPTLYDGLLRVGLVVSGPGITAGATINEPVSTLDLAATFQEWAGAPVPGDMQSRSLAGLLAGRPETRDFAYNEWNVHPARCGVPLHLRTVRTTTARLTIDLLSGAGELYRLDEDPFEMVNRFDDPGCAPLQRELTDMIHARPGRLMADLPDLVEDA